MSTSETYTIEYDNSALGYKAATYIFLTILIAFIAYLSRSDIITSMAWISLALLTACGAFVTLHKLIFRARAAILVISPEGIKDTRLGSDFIRWADIEKIDVPTPRKSLGIILGAMLLGFCVIVVAIVLSEGAIVGVESLSWSQPNRHVWLRLAPGYRVIGQLRGSRRHIRQGAEDIQHVCIVISDLTYGKQGLLELMAKFHARYTKTEKTEDAA
ncbi:hypothetical protein A6U86_03225 [Rhizobium sp. AC27/96]|uniref:hypothetical protein n=1 Tax=Rhizobium TaxID=379 RepID=UPI00082791F1|nr:MULTISPECIES: hypothetical protein [Rhizobium]NTF41695.1 hypothetical protein [Rhizobium rhizogenes]OCJ12077.1 hypothetical protein A6U86_03225 [Rhizobium sp. AC27/96]